MSAWPQAVYIIKELEKSMGLTDRIVRLENRLYVFAKQKSGVREPDLEKTYDFSSDSVWFVEDAADASIISAVSVYSQTSGWSSFMYFSDPNADASTIAFDAADDDGILKDATTVQAALDALDAAVKNIDTGGGGGPVEINDATTNSKGIVQIGNNINVTGGVISVPAASSSVAGVVRMYNTTGPNTDGTMTQAAIRAAIGTGPAKSEDVQVSGWSTNTIMVSGRDEEFYYVDITLTSSYGDHPAIAVAATSPHEVPTKDEVNAFNKVDFVIVNGSSLRFYSTQRIDTAFTVNIKL